MRKPVPAKTAAENAAAESAALVTFTPAEDFTGYPDGKTKVQFKAGIESGPVTEDFALLMREKGHVAKGTQFRVAHEDETS